MPLTRFALASVLALSAATTQAADWSLSVYAGAQTAPHSDVTGNDPAGVGAFDFFAAWEGKSTAMPPYYGIRGTMWASDSFGWIADYTHSKVYADDETLAESGFTRLEFTDGLNNVTVGPIWRWNEAAWGYTPYASISAGFVMPHVDVQSTGPHTYGYQLVGPSVAWVAGLSTEINDRWDAFAEYKGTYSQIKADLEDGGTLETDIITNAINLGLTYNF